MKIAFIGAGKVSAALGLYFKNNGFEIGGYYSIGGASAGKAAQLTSSTHYSSLERLINDNQLIWIATPDDQIEKVVQQISHLEITGKTDKLILHVSGVYSLSILDPLKVTGYQTGSAHPLLAFGDPVVTQQTLHGAWFAVEKGEEDNGRLNLLLESCGNPTFTVTPGRKPLYHAAACLLSNYLVTLMDASCRIFERSGLPADKVREATWPLFESVVRNLNEKEPKEALTGPVKRGDSNTVRLHLESLRIHMPEMSALYTLLGKETVRLSGNHSLEALFEE